MKKKTRAKRARRKTTTTDRRREQKESGRGRPTPGDARNTETTLWSPGRVATRPLLLSNARAPLILAGNVLARGPLPANARGSLKPLPLGQAMLLSRRRRSRSPRAPYILHGKLFTKWLHCCGTVSNTGAPIMGKNGTHPTKKTPKKKPTAKRRGNKKAAKAEQLPLLSTLPEDACQHCLAPLCSME